MSHLDCFCPAHIVESAFASRDDVCFVHACPQILSAPVRIRSDPIRVVPPYSHVSHFWSASFRLTFLP
eukprot:5621039-Prymnesium_polylepis.1